MLGMWIIIAVNQMSNTDYVGENLTSLRDIYIARQTDLTCFILPRAGEHFIID